MQEAGFIGIEVQTPRKEDRVHHGEILRHGELTWIEDRSRDVDRLGLEAADKHDDVRVQYQPTVLKTFGDLILDLAFKENVAVVYAAFGACRFIASPRRLWALGLFLACSAYFAAAVWLIVPAFNAYFYFRLGYWIAKRLARALYRVRLGYADELASMVMELLTNDYMNGEVVRADGGVRLPPK